ncbi:MAG: oxygen-independent coproporphyrinogen III oxidase [Lachnospiraceae bacterium]|nr:oxygen-independent coproporphyrinogen III oxidase [Lachnospiraceae bacterium]
MNLAEKELSIYVHIPFCVQKCLYCDFLSAPASKEVRRHYVDRLIREIKGESESYVNYKVKTIFLGGGTPSLLEPAQIAGIMNSIHENYSLEKDCEITIEVNPGTCSKERADAWRNAGINRVSIGLQSLEDMELKALGRIHSADEFYETYEEVVKTGFNNINIDLMTAIPGQTMESCCKTLRAVTTLNPAPVHISAYSLIIEEETPFFENTPVLPDEDTEREMYKITNDILFKSGYQRYEISNYAKPGFECRHNEVYWQRGNYAGFGIGAASLVENVRFTNGRDLKRYLENGPVKENRQELSQEEQMEEFMFLGLRMMQGVSEKKFQRLFGRTIDQVYPGIVDKHIKNGLLQRFFYLLEREERIMLTDRGIDVSNVVMADFLLT